MDSMRPSGCFVDALHCRLQFSMADMIKAEIYKRGPVACGVFVTPPFVAYTGGIFSDDFPAIMPNHEISVVGYGVANGTE